MAQSGRKPKLTEVKILEGNPGKRSINTQEPKPEKKAPRCPAWLEDEAKKEWKRMAKQLEQLGILTDNGEDKENDAMELLLFKGGAGSV